MSFGNLPHQLGSIRDDSKLASAKIILEDWLRSGFNPVVFCCYIATANYVGEQPGPELKKKFPKLDLQVITSELPDDLRKQRTEAGWPKGNPPPLGAGDGAPVLMHPKILDAMYKR